MKLRNGAHVDRVIDINPTATSAIAQHNASLPLLRLPLEVKNLIYKYTLGGDVIHIIHNPDENAAKFKNTICRALISEEEAQENFECEDILQWNAPANEGRHDCCRFQKGPTLHDGKQRPERLSLTLLRCCRQIYNEAHHIPYSTNTFSCADPETLQSFVVWLAQGSDANHLVVRSLFLEMVYAKIHHENSWKRAVATCATQLKALQKVSISIDWRNFFLILKPRLRLGIEFEQYGMRWKKQVVSSILTLKKLPLKTVIMVISDKGAEEDRCSYDDYWINHEAEYRWTLEEKKEMARYIREVLLEPNC